MISEASISSTKPSAPEAGAEDAIAGPATGLGTARRDSYQPETWIPDLRTPALAFDPASLVRTASLDGTTVDDHDREARDVIDFLRPAFIHPNFLQSLDQLRREVLDHEESAGDAKHSWLVPAIEGMAMAATTGLLAGVLRASSLAAMAISSVPFWKRVDPLMILSLSADERRAFEDNLRLAGEGEAKLDAVLDGHTKQVEPAAEDEGERP